MYQFSGSGNVVAPPATTEGNCDYQFGHRIAQCCGSQLVSDLSIDKRDSGITIALGDKPHVPSPDDSALFESVQVGDVYINLKLRQVP
jgi:hypothetical protein